MNCTKPYYTGCFYVPCGQCLNCRIQKSREWSVRLMHELNSWETASFITLTYNDKYLPIKDEKSQLVKADLQNFFKRLRRDLDKEKRKLKYLACGEYGKTNTKRPHYHAIVFGIHPINDQELILSNWKLGDDAQQVCGTVTYDSCRYVCDYVLKNKTGKEAGLLYEGREKPFRLISNGLGLDFIKNNEKQFMDNMYMIARGSKMGLPRYYKDKLGLDRSCFVENALDKKEVENKRYEGWEIAAYVKDIARRNEQRDKNLRSKLACHEKEGL